MRLRLLLHLLALIAGFNGLIAGPAAARASEPAVIAAAVSGSMEQAGESAAVHLASVQAPTLVEAPALAEARDLVFVPQTHPVDERRIE
ncbi:MAG TPA: hypothetical protein VFT73_01405 [Sphingomonas sp.]|nr:hypothetical protein [Sphingomonas sp.]